MEILYEKDNIVIINGDCRDVLKELDVNCIDACVTDPPYGLEFMGKGWDKGVPSVDFWKEILRVLKPGAHNLAFGGTRTFHRLACAIEDSGFELRDCMMWLYGQGFPKSLDISKALDKSLGDWRGKSPGPTSDNIAMAGPNYIRVPKGSPIHDIAKLWGGYGTALKPAWEPIIVGMKPTDGTFAENAQKWGVAGLNIDGCRIGTEKRFNPPAGNKPGTNSLNMSVYGMPADAQEPWASGRFPSNLILDEESGKMLDGQTGFLLGAGNIKQTYSKRKKKTGLELENSSIRPSPPKYDEGGGASRFFYCAKASKSDRGDGNNHPTVKPSSLMDYLVNLVKPPKGAIIIDPFMGSGSTLLAAKRLGLQAIGIDLSREYCDMGAKRLESSESIR